VADKGARLISRLSSLKEGLRKTSEGNLEKRAVKRRCGT